MLQRSKDKKVLYNELETQLYTGIQKDPGNVVYTELLIWLYVQRKDFGSALIHAKAIDKRREEEGKRVFDLALAARREQKYDDAIKAYEYLLTKGDRKAYYMLSKTRTARAFRVLDWCTHGAYLPKWRTSRSSRSPSMSNMNLSRSNSPSALNIKPAKPN